MPQNIKNEPLREELAESNPEMLFMDGHDDALIGVAMRYGMNDVAAYSYDKIIEGLMRDGMSEDEAMEFFEFNQIGAWMGENTPVIVQLVEPEPMEPSAPETGTTSTGSNMFAA